MINIHLLTLILEHYRAYIVNKAPQLRDSRAL